MPPLLVVQGLAVHFGHAATLLRAVDNVSFLIAAGELLGLVGESGSGKTITGRAILRLLPPGGRVVSGRIVFKDQDMLTLSEGEMRRIRGKEITVIQQDPLASLNPSFRIGVQLTDILRLHRGLEPVEAEREAMRLLGQVGMPEPHSVLRKYPLQLSGGMLQRVMIAIAFSCHPSLVIADEPTTALDVVTQVTVITLMRQMQAEHGTAIIFITHNLGLAAKICQRIAVMQRGEIVEEGATEQLLATPRHPYTQALLEAVPRLQVPTRKILSRLHPGPRGT